MIPLERQTVDLQSEEALALAASFAALDGDAAKHAGKDAKQAKLFALKAALKGQTMVKDRYQLEPNNQEQGASAVVMFAYDTLSAERVALKFMVDEAEFAAERKHYVLAACKFVVKVRDVVNPAKDSSFTCCSRRCTTCTCTWAWCTATSSRRTWCMWRASSGGS